MPNGTLLFQQPEERQSSNWYRRWKERGLAVVSVGRGAAFGDIFNDGKIDVVINNMDGVPVLLRNVNPDHHHWVELKLIGGPRVPATRWARRSIWLRAGCASAGDVLSGGSYLPRTIFAFTLGWAMRPLPVEWRFTGQRSQGNASVAGGGSDLHSH